MINTVVPKGCLVIFGRENHARNNEAGPGERQSVDSMRELESADEEGEDVLGRIMTQLQME